MAKAEARLEQLAKYLHPGQQANPYDALPYYKEAIRLRPNGILYHYAFALYLFSHNRKEDLLRVVRNLSRIYPPVYHYLRKEKFWSPPVKEAVSQGLEQAIKQGISLRDAHKVMSAMFASDKAWADAITNYKHALRYKAFENTAGDYIHLGRLYLMDRKIEEAKKGFFKGLAMSRVREKDLEGIYRFFKKQGLMEELYDLYLHVNSKLRLSGGLDILMARSLIDLKQYNKAQRILNELNHKGPSAKAYYWLARIAEIEKDWDSMELAIQKAALLESENIHYRQKFIWLLKRLGKLESAESQVSLLIQNSKKPHSRIFSERAWIRWKRKNWPGAASDWKSAIRLSPRIASFYARAAEAYIKLGNWSQAVDYYKKAVKFDPKNKRYQERYQKLKAEG